MPLTPSERETVITMNDRDDFAYITTWQRRIVVKLRDNPAAELIRIEVYGSDEGYTFRLPARLISIRQPRVISEETRAKLAENISKARQVRSVMQQPLVTRMDPITG